MQQEPRSPCDPAVRKHPIGFKPLTEQEILARNDATFCLHLATLYADEGNIDSAVFCCRTGLLATHGVSRPLAVRDQSDDLLETLAPEDCHSTKAPSRGSKLRGWQESLLFEACVKRSRTNDLLQ